MSYKAVSEVVAKLGDRGFAEGHVVSVNKGTAARPRDLDVIEWHEAVRMLDEAFGPFGWDAEIVGSTSDYASGLYTVDMTLTGRALDDVTGEVITLKRPGRGLGLVPRSAIESDAEHDRQAHGAKSDAITNATKGLGDGFGLYLYKKKPATSGYTASSAAPKASSRGADQGSQASGDLGFRPSDKQMNVLRERGYTDEQVASLEFKQWKGVLDAIFGKTTPDIAPAGEPAPRQAPRRAAVAVAEEDEIPF